MEVQVHFLLVEDEQGGRDGYKRPFVALTSLFETGEHALIDRSFSAIGVTSQSGLICIHFG